MSAQGPRKSGEVAVKPSRLIAVAATAATVASVSVDAPAFADNGKSGGAGCSPQYTLVSYDLANGELILPDGNPEPNTLNGLDTGVFTVAFADALFSSLDHNGDGALCFKYVSGWDQPQNGNGRAGIYVNLVDDYKS